jgi:thiamine pyrophosphate-dependent acetolactate synthase large subunit-like protein
VKVAQAVAETLVELGADTVFGLIGSGNFAVTNAMVASGTRFVASRHESGAITMADAYARVTGRTGVCSVHQGPGFTNTITGLTEAAKSRTPLLVLAADTAAAAVRSNFRIDQARLAEAAGAVPERLHSAATAVSDAVRAWRLARVERRPVVLSMPLDVQAADSPDGTSLRAEPRLRPLPPAMEDVRMVAALVAQSRRPLILAGRGAVLAGARQPLESLGDAAGALLATSAVANGLFAGNPWSVGISGGFATPLAAELIRQSDLVLSFGASLNMWTTRHGALFEAGTEVVQVDVDPDAFGAHRPVGVAVLGDAAETASALLGELTRGGHQPSGWRSAALADDLRRGQWRDQPFDDAGDGERIDPRTLSIALDDIIPKERIIAIDSGHFMGYPAMYWSVPDEKGFVFTQAFQSIGLGLATAIGAAVARPDRLVVAALGDGGALMSLSELETAARLRLPLLILVYNDAAYGAEVHHFGPQGAPLDLVRFPDTDFAALARAAGAEGVTVRVRADLEPVARWVERRPERPLLVDAKVVPSVVAEWLEEAFRGH